MKNLFSQGDQEIRTFKRILVFTFIAVLLMMEVNHLIALEKFSILAGKRLGLEGKMWLEVESEKDKAIVHFRIGRKIVSIPHRYPNVGERVKVEYLLQRGTPVAFTVNILEGAKQRGGGLR